MYLFANLIDQVIHHDSEISRVDALTKYFNSGIASSDFDVACNLLLGKCPKRVVSTRQLKTWATELTGLPGWLIERSEKETGSFLQSFNLLLGAQTNLVIDNTLSKWLTKIDALHDLASDKIQDFIVRELPRADSGQRMILLKLMTGNFKSPVSRHEIALCLSGLLKLKKEIVSLRLYKLHKLQKFQLAQLKKKIEEEDQKIPSDFPAIESFLDAKNIPDHTHDCIAFGRKDGVEAQLVKHGNDMHLWTRMGDIISDKYPEIIAKIPDSMADFNVFGQIVANNGGVSREHKSARLKIKSRTNTNKKIVDSTFEIWQVICGEINTKTAQNSLIYPERLNYTSRKELNQLYRQCRVRGYTGIIFQRLADQKYSYWKAEPLTINAVLMHVELGNFDRSGIQSLAFGIHDENEIVPIAKISDIEDHIDTDQIVDYAKSNTIDRFGPVRSLKLQLIYQISYDRIVISSRRKSGVALVNAKLIRFAGNDLAAVDRLASIKKLL